MRSAARLHRTGTLAPLLCLSLSFLLCVSSSRRVVVVPSRVRIAPAAAAARQHLTCVECCRASQQSIDYHQSDTTSYQIKFKPESHSAGIVLFVMNNRLFDVESIDSIPRLFSHPLPAHRCCRSCSARACMTARSNAVLRNRMNCCTSRTLHITRAQPVGHPVDVLNCGMQCAELY